MKLNKLIYTIVLFICIQFTDIILADTLSICSFNIQFLGNSKNRDNNALTDIVKGYDIVVVQELVAPPYPGLFPNGVRYNPDSEAAAFFDLMYTNGFKYLLSEEDTGPGKKNHINSTGTEWWVVFYKDNKVKIAEDIPSGFLAGDRTANPSYDRVPYAFAFRTLDNKLDFVLISVHLHPGGLKRDVSRRNTELKAINRWINRNNDIEKDFIILGDMNIEDKDELQSLDLPGIISLNNECRRTNTLINLNVNNGAKPYDHIMYNIDYSQNEIDLAYDMNVIDLVEKMRTYWRALENYPGEPYKHDIFRSYYSDHHPVIFRMIEQSLDDD